MEDLSNLFSLLMLHLGYRWNDFVSNRPLFRETDSTCITCIVRQCQLRLHGQVTRYPEVDSAHWVVPVRDKRQS